MSRLRTEFFKTKLIFVSYNDTGFVTNKSFVKLGFVC